MYKFHYDCNKNRYDNKSKLLLKDTGNLMHKIKLKISMKILAAIKKCLVSLIIWLKIWFDYIWFKSKYYDDSKKLVIGKMKNETEDVATEELVRLKPKMYSFSEDNNEHRKAKGVNKNVVATIGNNEDKNVLLNNNFKDTQWIEFKVKTAE